MTVTYGTCDDASKQLKSLINIINCHLQVEKDVEQRYFHHPPLSLGFLIARLVLDQHGPFHALIHRFSPLTMA